MCDALVAVIFDFRGFATANRAWERLTDDRDLHVDQPVDVFCAYFFDIHVGKTECTENDACIRTENCHMCLLISRLSAVRKETQRRSVLAEAYIKKKPEIQYKNHGVSCMKYPEY